MNKTPIWEENKLEAIIREAERRRRSYIEVERLRQMETQRLKFIENEKKTIG